MSDPFSVAGTVVGITSLGIQVCQALAQYYNQFKGWDEAVFTVLRRVEVLKSTLELIKSIRKVETDDDNEVDDDGVSRQLERALEVCTTDLRILERMAQMRPDGSSCFARGQSRIGQEEAAVAIQEGYTGRYRGYSRSRTRKPPSGTPTIEHVRLSCHRPFVATKKPWHSKVSVSGFGQRSSNDVEPCAHCMHNNFTHSIEAQFAFCTRMVGFYVKAGLWCAWEAGWNTVHSTLRLRVVVSDYSPAFNPFRYAMWEVSSLRSRSESSAKSILQRTLFYVLSRIQNNHARPDDVDTKGATVLHVTWFTPNLGSSCYASAHATPQQDRSASNFTL